MTLPNVPFDPFNAHVAKLNSLEIALVKGHYDPFLAESIQDVIAVEKAIRLRSLTSRQVICLMHDALEFMFYAILKDLEIDIYKNGQNTLGFDESFGLVEKRVRIPFLGSIRRIQKLRGDAKHHAQSPPAAEFERLYQDWRLSLAELAFRCFGESLLGDAFDPALPVYDEVLYRASRRAAKKSQEEAIRLLAIALRQKVLHHLHEPIGVEGALNAKAALAAARTTVGLSSDRFWRDKVIHELDSLLMLDFAVDASLAVPHHRSLANLYVANAPLRPVGFALSEARKITERLVMPASKSIDFGRHAGLSAAKLWPASEADSAAQLQRFLRDRPAALDVLGPYEQEDDDDRYWRWWELAVFDGSEWMDANLTYSFLLSIRDRDDLPGWNEEKLRIADLILAEFKAALSSAN